MLLKFVYFKATGQPHSSGSVEIDPESAEYKSCVYPSDFAVSLMDRKELLPGLTVRNWDDPILVSINGHSELLNADRGREEGQETADEWAIFYASEALGKVQEELQEAGRLRGVKASQFFREFVVRLAKMLKARADYPNGEFVASFVDFVYRTERPCRKFRAEFALDDRPEDGVAWVSCGDYQHWHIGVWRDAIRKRYGEEAAGNVREDDTGHCCFYYAGRVDLNQIAEDIGVKHSGPSSSSSSSSV